MKNKNEKIPEIREVVLLKGGLYSKYQYLTIKAEDDQEAYIFPQVLVKDKWEFIICNNYDNKHGIQNFYTTEKLNVNFGSTHKYVYIGCHQPEFADELIKCHQMGLGKYIGMKNSERRDREQVTIDKLAEMSYADLHALYELANDGSIKDVTLGETTMIYSAINQKVEDDQLFKI